jgi:hypothetical protein
MPSARTRSLYTLLPTALLAGFGLFWFSDTIADPDLWGHIRFGQDILRTGSIIQSDIYSYRTHGQQWINHEWLSEVIFAAVHDRWGPEGLIVLKCLIGLLILALGYAQLRRKRLERLPAVALLLVLCIPFRLGLATVRPQMFTYLMFLELLLVLENAVSLRQIRIWTLPVLFAAWVNLHGGVLAGVGVLGLWMIGRLVEGLRDASRTRIERLGGIASMGLLACSCGLALLVNPYGAGLPRFLLRTATVPRPEISEWVPVGLLSFAGLLFLLLLLWGIVGMALSARCSPGSSLIFGVTAILPLLSSRHYPLFAFALVVEAGGPIADLWNRGRPIGPVRWGESRFLGAAGLTAALVLCASSLPHWRCVRIEPFYFPFPARAVGLLRQSGIQGNLALPYDWGEYVLWHLGPGVKVSIDGRRETVYADESLEQAIDFESGTRVWDALLRTAPTDLILVPNGSPTANLLSLRKDWLPLYQDGFCALFGRPGSPGLDRLLQTSVPDLPDDGDGLCFPGLRRLTPEARARGRAL